MWLHTYLGHPLPGYGLQEAPPPLYFFVFVLPLTSLFGDFLGIQVLMALIPALVAFPTYLLIQWAGYGRIRANIAAALMSTSTAFSEMVTWNSGFNMAGILFLLFFWAFLIHSLRSGGRSSLIAAAAFMVLVTGTHQLALIFLVVSVGVYAALTALVKRGYARGDLRRLGMVVLLGTGLSLVFLPIYISALQITSNVGPPSSGYSWNQLLFTYAETVGFPWGSATPFNFSQPEAIWLAFDIALTIVALPTLWIGRVNQMLATYCTSVFVATLVLAALDPANAIRAVYFMPIAAIPAIIALPRSIAEQLRRAKRSSYLVRAAGRIGVPSQRGLVDLTVSTFAVIIAINVGISTIQMEQAERFYSELSPDAVSALGWVDQHTNDSAVFYDGAHLGTWILGYAQRLSYSPSPLQSTITSVSYQRAVIANLVDMGQYVLADSQAYVTSNAPGVYNSPGFMLRTPGFWFPVWLGESDKSYVTVAHGNVSSTLLLAGGSSLSTTGGANGSEASMTIVYQYPSKAVAIAENLSLQAGSASVSITSLTPGARVVNCTFYFRSPPSGYNYFYSSYPTQNFSGQLRTQMNVPYVGDVSATLSGANVSGNVSTEATGWTALYAQFSTSLTLTFTGWPAVPGSSPAFYQTLNLVRSLGVNYFIVSYSNDYPLYERLFALSSQRYLNLPQVFAAGSIRIIAFP